MHRAVSAVAVVGSVMCLSGCLGGADGSLANLVEDQLRAEEDVRTVTVDFDALVDGDWTRLVLICWASQDAISDALGFEWVQPDRHDVRSGYAYVFATDTEVEQFFGPVTWAPFDDRTYVSSCNPEPNDITVHVLEREIAVINYLLVDNELSFTQQTWIPVSDLGPGFKGDR